MCRRCDTDCEIDENFKSCACVKHIDDLVNMSDEIKDLLETVSINYIDKRNMQNGLLYFLYFFISIHIINNHYYLLLLHKTKNNIKMVRNNELKETAIVPGIIFMT